MFAPPQCRGEIHAASRHGCAFLKSFYLRTPRAKRDTHLANPIWVSVFMRRKGCMVIVPGTLQLSRRTSSANHKNREGFREYTTCLRGDLSTFVARIYLSSPSPTENARVTHGMPSSPRYAGVQHDGSHLTVASARSPGTPDYKPQPFIPSFNGSISPCTRHTHIIHLGQRRNLPYTRPKLHAQCFRQLHAHICKGCDTMTRMQPCNPTTP